MAEPRYLFFALTQVFAAFSFQGKLIYSLTDIHVQHLDSLCRICGDNIKDHKRKVDTTLLVSEITKSGKIYSPLDSPNVHRQLKKSKKEGNFNCK